MDQLSYDKTLQGKEARELRPKLKMKSDTLKSEYSKIYTAVEEDKKGYEFVLVYKYFIIFITLFDFHRNCTTFSVAEIS